MADHPPLLLTFYGDDFTGSTDVMESLVRAGVPTALFVDPPTPDQLARFPGVRAVGVAGMSRSMSPGAMGDHLPAVFESLRALGAPLVHYKVCSTFDSSPQVGSIGCAMELGWRVFRPAFVPLVVGTPVLGRYCVFGNLFARAGLDTEPSRIDRHPVMSRHPITPMDEADLRMHLGRQTNRSIALLDVLKLGLPADRADAALDELLAGGAEVVLFDGLTDDHLRAVGRLVWRRALGAPPLFAVGASGLEYALTAHWRALGELPQPAAPKPPTSVDRLMVVSGSCSPVTDRQIAWAVGQGFAELPIDTVSLLDAPTRDAEVARVVDAASGLLSRGRSVIAHLARSGDGRVERVIVELHRRGLDDQAVRRRSGELLGPALGQVLRRVLERTPLPRVAVAGGDTSGFVARATGIEALEMLASLAPGSPVCRAARAGGGAAFEIVFKGGQVGAPDFFGRVMGRA